MSRLGWQGAALFGFIPLVLYLYLQHPLGPGLSLGSGLILMFGHRFIAAPWTIRHGAERCFWCGRTDRLAARMEVSTGGKVVSLAACDVAHRRLAGRFLTFVARFRPAIAFGIFAPLVVLLAGTAALALGRPLISHEWNRVQFRALVAATVVGVSVGYLAVKDPVEPLTCPFPLHNLFLLGVRKTLWVFRVVGVWWLAAVAAALGRLVGS